MRIGLDFDNTLVGYDRLFHKVALEQGVIPEKVPVNKIAVRDFLRTSGREDIWTEMQGYVYGLRMAEAEPYPGALDTLRSLRAEGHRLCIISHKTKYPFAGPKYDLHAAARSWIATHLQCSAELLIDHADIFFEMTKADKLERIAALSCDVFLDDLPEILLADGFPVDVRKLLFDPDNHHSALVANGLERIGNWLELPSKLQDIAGHMRSCYSGS